MFIISLKYKTDLAEVDRYLSAHKDFLTKYFANNTFIAAGRKVPRDGGIIITVAENKTAVEKIIAKDPFKIADVADYTITEFIASTVNQNLNEFKDE